MITKTGNVLWKKKKHRKICFAILVENGCNDSVNKVIEIANLNFKGVKSINI